VDSTDNVYFSRREGWFVEVRMVMGDAGGRMGNDGGGWLEGGAASVFFFFGGGGE